MHRAHGRCVDLLDRLVKKSGTKRAPEWAAAQRQAATAVVTGLTDAGKSSPPPAAYWSEDKDADEAEPEKTATVAAIEAIAGLLDTLGKLEADELRSKAAANIAANRAAFDPVRVVVPALSLLNQRHGERANAADASFLLLWQHAAEFLLTRSEHPPEPPRDWKQDATISCRCEDCRELQSFVINPAEQTHRFRVRQDRRQHLHRAIETHSLDMTHTTDRKGSPQTLVCTKTRRTYERRCAQYRGDLASMTVSLTFCIRLAAKQRTCREGWWQQ
jgi:hypothetical protein